jgi:hypothetical protein
VLIENQSKLFEVAQVPEGVSLSVDGDDIASGKCLYLPQTAALLQANATRPLWRGEVRLIARSLDSGASLRLERERPSFVEVHLGLSRTEPALNSSTAFPSWTTDVHWTVEKPAGDGAAHIAILVHGVGLPLGSYELEFSDAPAGGDNNIRVPVEASRAASSVSTKTADGALALPFADVVTKHLRLSHTGPPQDDGPSPPGSVTLLMELGLEPKP